MSNKRKAALIIALLVFCIGLAMVVAPMIHGQVLEQRQTQQTVAFLEQIQQIRQPADSLEKLDTSIVDGPYQALWEDMVAYNTRLIDDQSSSFNSPEAYEQVSFNLADYGLDSEVFGILKIPALELEIPLYLGANYSNLAKGAAHLSETSLPIGGESTNCVVAGHRGWQGGEYFLHLTRLKAGDIVEITNPWETLTYKVMSTEDIGSTDTHKVYIQDGEDLLTLLTCDYGAGVKYRYIVVCERV